jgi:hypothetical protein
VAYAERRASDSLDSHVLNGAVVYSKFDDEFPLNTIRSVLSQRNDERQGGLTLS